MAEVPFILKGIMTPNAARKALEAGVQGIVVSNHGGRVLDRARSNVRLQHKCFPLLWRLLERI